jgi:hypothetical protein
MLKTKIFDEPMTTTIMFYQISCKDTSGNPLKSTVEGEATKLERITEWQSLGYTEIEVAVKPQVWRSW